MQYHIEYIKIHDSVEGQQIEDIIPHCIKKYTGVSQNILIAIGGPGGTGKSTFSKKLALMLDAPVLHLDDYKTAREDRKELKIFGAYPNANHIGLIKEHLDCIKKGIPFDKPLYNSFT